MENLSLHGTYTQSSFSDSVRSVAFPFFNLDVVQPRSQYEHYSTARLPARTLVTPLGPPPNAVAEKPFVVLFRFRY